MSARLRLFQALCVMLCTVGASMADPLHVYDVDVPAESVSDALTDLAKQTGVSVVFPYDLVKDRRAASVVGRYTLLDALDVLLRGTGLSGGLSDRGVLTVSQAKPDATYNGETFVTQDERQPNNNIPKAARRSAIAAFFASAAAAFSASAHDTSDSLVDPSKMESIIVSAEKRDERVQDVPVAISVLSPAQLADFGQDRLVDFYASVPGLSLSNGAFYGGTQYITIRGLSTGFAQNPTVGTVVDDVPANSSGGALTFGNLTSPDIDPGDLQRIEVLKGPQGTLYGADSLGGLIKYVTVDPSTAGFSSRVEVSGVDIPGGGVGYSVRGSANIPVNDTLAIRASGFSRRDPGYVDDVQSGQTNVNTVDVYGGRISALWRLAPDISLKVSALVQQTDGKGSPYFNAQLRSDGAVVPTQGYLQQTGPAYANPYRNQEQLYTATFKAKVADVDLVSVTGYSVNKLHDLSDNGESLNCCFSSPVDFNPQTTGGVSNFETDKISQELRASTTLSHWADVLVGGYYTHEKAPKSYQDFFTADLTGAVGQELFNIAFSPFTLTEYALFGDLTIHATDRFDVQLGGRESWNKQELEFQHVGPAVIDFYGVPSPDIYPTQRASGNAFTYLVTPRFKISDDSMIYARLASGYRLGGPNFNAGRTGVPDQYKPDKTTNYELGAKSDFLDHRVSFDASVYFIRWHDFQLSLLNQDFVFFQTNAGGAQSSGAELSLQVRPTTGLSIAVQGAFNNAKLTEDLPPGAVVAGAYGVNGDRLPYSIRWSGGITINQDIHLSQGWTGFVGGGLNYVGLRDGEFAAAQTLPRPYFPAYTALNLHTGARFNSWLFNLYVDNVADKRAVTGAVTTPTIGATGGYYGTLLQPRSVGMSVVKNW